MNIAATLTRCRHGQALVVLNDRPFNGLEVTPQALRRMAQQLTAIADMASKLPLGGKHWAPTKVDMGHSPVPHVAPSPAVGGGCKTAAASATRRTHIQHLCLEMLGDRRPGYMTSPVVLVNVQQYYPDAIHNELMRELDYLELKGLLTMTRRPASLHHIQLTAEGMDWVDARRLGLDGGAA